jgi:hypothetical protein
MNGQKAKIIFLIVCIILAILLLTKVITPIISGTIFAVALVLLGGLSSGFRKK